MQEVNEEIKEKVVRNLMDYVWLVNNIMTGHIAEMASTESVEEFMYVKKRLLVDYVRSLPVNGEYFYFCLKNMKCENCEYGKIFGTNEDNSVCRSLVSQRYKVYTTIYDRYYCGETYETDIYTIDIKKSLLSTFVKWWCTTYYHLWRRILQMKERETVEELIFDYYNLLSTWINRIPLETRFCCFCLVHEECKECEYGEIHGMCSEKDSDYAAIVNKLDSLRKIIDDQVNYWNKRGEKV